MRQSKAHAEKPVRGRLLDMNEAEERIGLSKEWMYKRMKKGTLPFPWFMTSPGKRFIDSADIEDWLRLVKVPAGVKPEVIDEEVAMKQ